MGSRKAARRKRRGETKESKRGGETAVDIDV